jgi:8-oxo-dGTP diphosphatase
MAYRQAYGGVVVNERGELLLFEPKNHFDGYVWTWPKGRADAGEAPEAAALREVREETGVEAALVGPLPGTFLGGTTECRYWLMRPRSIGKPEGAETQSVRWAAPAEAAKLIGQTTNAVGRARDLAILAAAVELLATTTR